MRSAELASLHCVSLTRFCLIWYIKRIRYELDKEKKITQGVAVLKYCALPSFSFYDV